MAKKHKKTRLLPDCGVKWDRLMAYCRSKKSYIWTQDEPFITEITNIGIFKYGVKKWLPAGWQLVYTRRYDWSVEYAVWLEKSKD